jgi:di/tricarboxylate transporter
LAFLAAVFLLITTGIIQIEDMLHGLANKQIIIIFLLIILTAGIQRNLGKGFFFKLFKKELSPFQFRLRMMVLVSGISSMLNNTPVVALMIPYVKHWADSNRYSASQFLIPLSFATILGGMITIVGTSTNLVLNGLIAQAGLPLLGFKDFLFLGLAVTVFGLIYLALFSGKLLPIRKGSKEEVIGHLNEYLVETLVSQTSNLIGKTIEDAGLRHLKELFLVEIKRGEEVITAVDSQEKIFPNDRLYFAGNTNSILNLINEKNGLVLPEQSYVQDNGFSDLTEAIVPTGSRLIGESLRKAGFRDEYKASVISIYRKGEKVQGNLGEIVLQAGDLLLMLCSKELLSKNPISDLILISKAGELDTPVSYKKMLPSFLAIICLLTGILGGIDLFLAAFLGVILMVVFKILDINQIKSAVDLDLLIVLISALAVGVAIQKSGTATFLVDILLDSTKNLSPIGGIAVLFFITVALTSLITNAAAVTIMFPMAYEMALQSGNVMTPYFVAIAFAASADFMTPIGYQTNLMVMGPGNYKFSDFTKIGLPLTLIYTSIVLLFINHYYF